MKWHWFVNLISHSWVSTMCKVPEDTRKQHDACGLGSLRRVNVPPHPIHFTLWEVVRTLEQFPSGRATGEKGFAAAADKKFGQSPCPCWSLPRTGWETSPFSPLILNPPHTHTPRRLWEPQSERSGGKPNSKLILRFGVGKLRYSKDLHLNKR